MQICEEKRALCNKHIYFYPLMTMIQGPCWDETLHRPNRRKHSWHLESQQRWQLVIVQLTVTANDDSLELCVKVLRNSCSSGGGETQQWGAQIRCTCGRSFSLWAATAVVGESELTGAWVDLRAQVAAMKLDRLVVIVAVLLSSVYCQDSDGWTGMLEQVRCIVVIIMFV